MTNRVKGALLAKKLGAWKTARVIESRCYREIFESAVKEIGRPKLVKVLVRSRCSEWILKALCYVNNLKRSDRIKLIPLLQAMDAHDALDSVPRLTRTEKSMLVEQMDAQYAFRTLDYTLNLLTKAQRIRLIEKLTPRLAEDVLYIGLAQIPSERAVLISKITSRRAIAVMLESYLNTVECKALAAKITPRQAQITLKKSRDWLKPVEAKVLEARAAA